MPFKHEPHDISWLAAAFLLVSALDLLKIQTRHFHVAREVRAGRLADLSAVVFL